MIKYDKMVPPPKANIFLLYHGITVLPVKNKWKTKDQKKGTKKGPHWRWKTKNKRKTKTAKNKKKTKERCRTIRTIRIWSSPMGSFSLDFLFFFVLLLFCFWFSSPVGSCFCFCLFFLVPPNHVPNYWHLSVLPLVLKQHLLIKHYIAVCFQVSKLI